MFYQSAHDLLQAELASQQKRGTSVTEKGLTVSVQPLNSEKVIFFHTDHDTVRTFLHMPPAERRSCDYLIFYATSEDDYQAEIVCFLELKGAHFNDAVEQVCNIYEYMKGMLEANVEKKQYINIIHSAYICIHGQAPAPRYELRGRKKLQQTFGPSRFKVKHTVKYDGELGSFLRGLYPHRL